MVAGGNQMAYEHFTKHGWSDSQTNGRTKSIENKYTSKAARLYKTMLDHNCKSLNIQTCDECWPIIANYLKNDNNADHNDNNNNNYKTTNTINANDVATITSQLSSVMFSNTNADVNSNTNVHVSHVHSANQKK